MKLLILTHLAVLGAGVTWGLRGSLLEESVTSGKTGETQVSSAGSGPVRNPAGSAATGIANPGSSEEHAAAWEILKGRALPRTERLLIQERLLETWSQVDLPSAVRAVLGEAAGVDDLLKSCAAGIQADPQQAWELVRSRAFGLETARFRDAWVNCMVEADPVRIFSILEELPKVNRLTALSSLADVACEGDRPAVREAVWSKFGAMQDTPANIGYLDHIGQWVSSMVPGGEIVDKLLNNPSPAERRIFLSAMSLAIFQSIEDEELYPLLDRLPQDMRAEVAAGSLKYGVDNKAMVMEMANLALASGNIDALANAAADPDFARFINHNGLSLTRTLRDWAMALPDDPRLSGIYRQIVEKSAYHDFEEVGERVHALPEGWKREEGLAAVKIAGERRRAEDEEQAEDE